MLHLRLLRCAIALLFAAMLLPLPASAQTDQPVQITSQSSGVVITWQGQVRAGLNGEPRLNGWTTQSIGDADLPSTLVALRVPDQQVVAPLVDQTSQPWASTLRRTTAITPRTLDGDARPDLASNEPLALPTTPATVLRDGHMRGTRIVVLAISPIFAQNGSTRAATSLRISVPGATVLRDSAADMLATSAPFIANAAPPTNSAAATPSWTIRVTQSGIQELSVAALAASGISASQVANLHLRRNGQEVILEDVRDGSGSVQALRFYAVSPGDRWNAADTYWLTAEATPGPRMASRSAMPAAAPVQTTALDRGIWRANKLYDTLLPGFDGDHWFAADFKTGPGLDPARMTATLTPTLPLASGTSTITVTGAAYTGRAHEMRVTVGSAQASAQWTGQGSWANTFVVADNQPQVLVELVPSTVLDGVEASSIRWERPVQLDFGGRGAQFVGVPGTWRYQISNSAPNRALYDITNPAAPVRLALPDGSSTQFQDGPDQRVYLLSGPSTLQTPVIAAHTPVDLASPLNADVLYIAPTIFHNALAPLVAWRQAQGYATRIVDVQAIYDSWSYGQVAPDAIRSFLRYAASSGSRAPVAVTLVGDGTSDPLNYTRRNNTNFIPPYLAMVDPWIGETACETCYAQLDGDAPQTGWTGDVLPDLMLGRLPAKSADEAAALVAKVLRYETTSTGQYWQTKNVFVADDADQAGDFSATSNAVAALQPRGTTIERVYYPADQDPAPSLRQTIAAFNAGAAFVNYAGHGNQFQWAVTGPVDNTSHLLDLNDAANLTNRSMLPIVLEMTCLTSSFQTPAFSGTSVGERLLMNPNGGGVAVWGPTGYGLDHGHSQLQTGFYDAVWNGTDRRLGTLTAAGYLKLYAYGCCPETIRTFVLLGEPLTQALADTSFRPGTRLSLPLVQQR